MCVSWTAEGRLRAPDIDHVPVGRHRDKDLFRFTQIRKYMPFDPFRHIMRTDTLKLSVFGRFPYFHYLLT